jgi:hypothetical protein
MASSMAGVGRVTVSERKSIMKGANELRMEVSGFKNKTYFCPSFTKTTLTDPDMSVTRLKRKHRKNIARQNNKQRIIKQLLLTPVLKNVDIEELKSRFNGGAAAPAAA